MILLTGFGPFMDVVHNPSAALARELDGARVGGATVVGEVLEVSYGAAPKRVIDLARAFRPLLVLGTGVARTRQEPELERFGRGGTPVGLDVKGRCPESLGEGRYECSFAAEAAAALGVGLSEDAGRYVCNAWLYSVGRGMKRPVAFLHIPPAGMDPGRLLKGLGRLLPLLRG